MTDLVERLRAYTDIKEMSRQREEAADEIERLRASEEAWRIIAKQNDRWNALPQTEREAALSKALDDAVAECERLRP